MKFLQGEIAGPLFWYLAFTLGVPLADGSSGAAFPRHALTILVVAAVLTAARIGLPRSPYRVTSGRNLHSPT